MSGNATTFAWRETETEELACAEAARLLQMPAQALEHWSRQLAFPSDVGEEGSPRYRRDEIDALRAALTDAHSVEGAIREARRRLDR